jgi:DNA polymerase III delta prime subunit
MTICDEFLWSQKYRPKTVKDCVLPDRIKNVFQEYVDKKTIPNLMLTGTAGVGKTTVALAMCDEIDCSTMFINSSKDRGIDVLRNRITSFASAYSLQGGRKVVILDEADYITPEAQAALRGAIEEFSFNCTFILTCNFKSKLIDAIHSRCSVIDFTLQNSEKPKMASLFFKRLSHILTEEKVEFKKEVIVKIVEAYFPDYRRTLNELQRHSTTGKIDIDVLSHITDVKSIQDLVKSMREKNFANMRKWVVVNSDIDPSRIFRKIYDGLYDFMKPESIPQAIVILAKYQHQAAFVVDQEINMVACLTEIVIDCEMK